MPAVGVSPEWIIDTCVGRRLWNRQLLPKVLLHRLHNGDSDDPSDAIRGAELDAVQAALAQVEDDRDR